jgi:hypothetical protein
MKRPPRSADEILSLGLGISPSTARAYRRRLPDAATYEETDARLCAEAALADVEAVESLDDVDLQDCRDAPDPIDEMRAILRDRSDRALIARIGAHSSWAQTEDRSARTRNARQAFLLKFEREVDPDGVLSHEERVKRAENARSAYFLRLALKSAQTRRKGAGS